MVTEHVPVVVVLGAAGFIGRHTARELAQRGFRVLGLGHGRWTKSEWRSWGISDWLQADIGMEALDKIVNGYIPQCIIHCGGSGGVSFSYSHPLKDFERATHSTAQVLEWIRIQRDGDCRFVFVSSAAVYGDLGGVNATENSPCAPISPYGVHKVAAESICESYSRFFGVSTSIVRLFSVYGEGLRKQLMWDALNKFSNGNNDFFGTGRELRDWLHIEDAARLLCAAALVPQSTFEVFNGSNQQATTSQVLKNITSIAFPGTAPRFNGEVHAGNPRRLTADSSKARGSLSWVPEIDLAVGVRRYVEWYLRNALRNEL